MFQLCDMKKRLRLRAVKRYVMAAGICASAAGLCMIQTGLECRAEAEIITTSPMKSTPIAGTSSPGEKQTSVAPPICNDDEYVLISSESNYSEIYDGQGNYISKCRTYADAGYEAYTVKKDYVLEYSDGSDCSIFSMADLREILRFPTDEYSVLVSADLTLAAEKNTGSLFLYDNHGELLYSCSGTAVVLDESLTDTETAGAECQGRILHMDNGYLIGSCRFLDNGNLLTGGPLWISKDFKETKPVTDSYLAEAFADWRLEAFGDYLITYSWETESGDIYNLDGNLLIDDIVSYFSSCTDDNRYWAFNSGSEYRTALAMQRGDGMCVVYDTALEKCAEVPVSEEGYWDYGYAGGFIKGAYYQELDGRLCDGFVQYGDSTWCPYAKTDEGNLVYVNGEKILFPYDQGSRVAYLNDAYVITGDYVDDSYVEHLYSRETGELLAESQWNENGGVYFSPGKNFCIITRDETVGEEYRISINIMDSQNQLSYQGNNGRASVWKNGYIMLSRGIYHGIADINGNWIVKTVAGWSE